MCAITLGNLNISIHFKQYPLCMILLLLVYTIKNKNSAYVPQYDTAIIRCRQWLSKNSAGFSDIQPLLNADTDSVKLQYTCMFHSVIQALLN